MTKPAELREKSESDLVVRERELREQLFKLRFQSSMGASENPMKIRDVRREIARIETILNEKKRTQSA
ncbi:MAG TPA: 50S ribosomal protein L29 [Thermoanaerobaculia bacterium]|nr:50S ribosomal protein L29 [Thermoanaerobaculia bacterium]